MFSTLKVGTSIGSDKFKFEIEKNLQLK